MIFDDDVRKIKYDDCPVKCAMSEEECENTIIKTCKGNLEKMMEHPKEVENEADN